MRASGAPEPLWEVIGAWRQLVQFAGMGLLVPFVLVPFLTSCADINTFARMGLLDLFYAITPLT
jgi:hypothetical protein